MGLFNFSADSGNPGHGANLPPSPPISTAPLRAGVYIRPWTEDKITLSALDDLKPGVVRINYPAFPLLLPDNQAEASRLVILIEAEINHARSIGALPLIVTTLKKIIAPATRMDILLNAKEISSYYAGVAKRFPGCAWEIGNEANIKSGGGDFPITPSDYAYTFNIHAQAIHDADSSAQLVTAGTSGFDWEWIRQVVELTALGNGYGPNAVGVHPYGINPLDYAQSVKGLGIRLPVWFTEWGRAFVTPTEVNDYYTHARGIVPLAVLFCLSDLSADKLNLLATVPQPFGLMMQNGVQRPSYDAAKIAYALK